MTDGKMFCCKRKTWAPNGVRRREYKSGSAESNLYDCKINWSITRVVCGRTSAGGARKFSHGQPGFETAYGSGWQYSRSIRQMRQATRKNWLQRQFLIDGKRRKEQVTASEKAASAACQLDLWHFEPGYLCPQEMTHWCFDLDCNDSTLLLVLTIATSYAASFSLTLICPAYSLLGLTNL